MLCEVLNLDRFVDRFFEHEPWVGVIGDVYERDDVDDHVAAAREIQASYPEAELIIVPKSRSVIDAVPDDIVLGYSRGYADRLAHEFSEPTDWRGRHVHILGGSPPKQLEAIQQRPDRRSLPIHQPTSWASTGTDSIAAHSSASSGRPTAGTTAVATPITSPFGRRCAIVSLEYVSSGSPTGSGPRRHHRTRGYTSSTGPSPADLRGSRLHRMRGKRLANTSRPFRR